MSGEDKGEIPPPAPPVVSNNEDLESNVGNQSERSNNHNISEQSSNIVSAEEATISSTKGVSDWIMDKLQPNHHEDDDNIALQPLKKTPNPSEDDREESSSSSSSNDGSRSNLMHRRRHHSTTDSMSGIEVEIESSVGGDDCLYRKRVLNTMWMIHKKQILLGCAFLGVWLFGILIGACGLGQCGRGGNSTTTTESSAAVKWQDLSSDCHAGDHNDNESAVEASESVQVEDYTSPPLYYTPPPIPPIVNSDPSNVLGPNTIVFDPTMTTQEIQAQADAVFRQQRNNEMGRERYALLFQPGTYGSVDQPLMIQIGYYTEVAGLGASPQDVRILGKIEVYNRCFEPDPYADGKFIPTDNSEQGLCFALNSFWRGLSNLSIQIVSRNQDQCRQTAMFWAISQAASMRRVNIEGGDVSLMDYCSNPAYASGGFIADSKAGKIISGSQQQFIMRNSHLAQWDGSAWNQVLVGVVGAPNDAAYPDPAITTLETNPLSREKPYLFVHNGDGEYRVHVPSLDTASRDVSWAAGPTQGRTIPLSEFFVASPKDSIATINEQLAVGKNLLLTPGQYSCEETIFVERKDTVVLGIGLATLTAVNGAVPLKVASQPGIVVAGVTLDAGLDLSPILLQVGDLGDSKRESGDANNPITLSDVYFRVGGPHIGKANVCLEINSNHVLVDHTWIWRADHGVEKFDKTDGFDGDNERWKTNIGLNGIVVNGNDVTATGLFVEHFQEYNLVWNGDRGRVYFFQNELPYEPPSQEEWTADDGTLGWAAYKVNPDVAEHELWCGGVYCYNRNNPDVVTTNGFEAPNREGVTLNHIYTRNLSGPGTIKNIVNGVGETVTKEEKGPFYVVRYPER